MSLEIKELKSWLGSFPRHPMQTHGLNESDSEVLKLDAKTYLAATVDSVSEEIAYGLYKDPFTMGWVAAMASLSDLAAVGASPTGILFSSQWGKELGREKRSQVAEGLRAALKKAKVHLLGGDSGDAAATQLTVTSLGLCDSKPLSRIGLKSGDWICITGKTGIGPALGFRHLLGHSPDLLPEDSFRPEARLREGFRLRKLASAAIDTSDGLASALSTLAKLNECSFDLDWSEDILARPALDYCRWHRLPETSLWFGEHGDFEVLCGIPDRNLAQAKKEIKGLIVLGKVKRSTHGHTLKANGSKRSIRLDLLSEAPKSSLTEIRAAFDRMVYYLSREGFP
jgi:thiamine-monophosphate kinase